MIVLRGRENTSEKEKDRREAVFSKFNLYWLSSYGFGTKRKPRRLRRPMPTSQFLGLVPEPEPDPEEHKPEPACSLRRSMQLRSLDIETWYTPLAATWNSNLLMVPHYLLFFGQLMH